MNSDRSLAAVVASALLGVIAAAAIVTAVVLDTLTQAPTGTMEPQR